MIAEYNDSYQISRRFIYGPGIDEPICMIDAAGAGETRYYYHGACPGMFLAGNGLGSVIALSNIDGDIVEAYSAACPGMFLAGNVYGTPTIYTDAGADGIWRTSDDTTDDESAIGNPYMFTGRRYDAETGLYYYRARMYSPTLGRFLQPNINQNIKISFEQPCPPPQQVTVVRCVASSSRLSQVNLDKETEF